MTPELDKQLCEKYHKIFRDRHASMMHTCMCWGLEVGDGWYNIIDNACWLIQQHIDQSRKQRASALQFTRAMNRSIFYGDIKGLEWYFTIGKRPEPDEWAKKSAKDAALIGKYRVVPKACPQLIATQVKEKFGTLSFYTMGGDDYTRGVLSMAESMTATTCEVCGAPGELVGQGWISCRCEKHQENEE